MGIDIDSWKKIALTFIAKFQHWSCLMSAMAELTLCRPFVDTRQTGRLTSSAVNYPATKLQWILVKCYNYCEIGELLDKNSLDTELFEPKDLFSSH